MIKRLSILAIVFLLISSTACAQNNAARNNAAKLDSSGLKYTTIPESPLPGEPITIAINSGADEAILFVNNRQISKAPLLFITGERGYPGFLAANITIPTTIPPGNAVIKLSDSGGVVHEIPFVIADRTFPSETIALNPVNTEIRSAPNPQRDAEANHLWRILTTTGDQIYHYGLFTTPIPASSRRTSEFGYRRIYQYSNGGTDTTIHAGIDYGIVLGTRVNACGRGRVVLAGMRIVSGNTVILEHAPGIYSLYYHLDSVSVKEGDIVNSGEQIGLSGSTGLSTGPHLHWEIRVNAENTDPYAFVSRQIIDKELIFSRLYE